MKKRILTVLFFALTASLLFAGPKEDYQRIKRSNDYYIGEAVAEIKDNVSDEQLKKIALSNMILQIQASVRVNISDTEIVQGGQLDQSTMHQVEMTSKIKLSDYKYISYKDRKKSYTLAYLKKSDYESWLEEQGKRLVSRMKAAIDKEGRFDIEAAMPEYMSIYALTMMIPQAIEFREHADLNLYVYDILQEYLKTCVTKSTIGKPNPQTPGTFPISFYITNAQKPVNNIKLSFAGEESEHKLINGRAELSYYGYSSEQQVEKAMVLKYDTEIAELSKEVKDLLKENPICHTFNHVIDFKSIVRVDFEIKQDGAEVELKPIVENISVKQTEWQFGDGSKNSTEKNPRHVYENNGRYRIVLTVNNTVNVTKTVTISGHAETVKRERPKRERVVKSNKIIEAGQADIEKLLSLKKIIEAIAWLNDNKNKGKLIFGTKDQVSNNEQAYILLFDAKSEGLITLISPDNNGRRDLKDNVFVKENEIMQKGRGAIWIQFLK